MTSQTIYNAVTHGTPCVIVEGSGRVADVIAQVASLPVSDITIGLIQQKLSELFQELFETFTEGSIVEWTKKVRQWPGYQCEAAPRTRGTQNRILSAGWDTAGSRASFWGEDSTVPKRGGGQGGPVRVTGLWGSGGQGTASSMWPSLASTHSASGAAWSSLRSADSSAQRRDCGCSRRALQGFCVRTGAGQPSSSPELQPSPGRGSTCRSRAGTVSWQELGWVCRSLSVPQFPLQ